MAFNPQVRNAIMGVPDFTSFVGPGYQQIPRSMASRQFLGNDVTSDRLPHRPQDELISSEIIAPVGLRDHSHVKFARMPQEETLLRAGPVLATQRLSQTLGLMHRHDYVTETHGLKSVQAPYPLHENPEHFAEVPSAKAYGFY